MGNPFLTFFFLILTKTPQNIFGTVIIYHFIGKLLSKLILDLRKCPNPKMHESESADFLVGHFPLFKISFENSFLIKGYINNIKKKLECFGQYFFKIVKKKWTSY